MCVSCGTEQSLRHLVVGMYRGGTAHTERKRARTRCASESCTEAAGSDRQTTLFVFQLVVLTPVLRAAQQSRRQASAKLS